MGFFDEIKKVLFGAKSVSKSAADKMVDKGREAANKSGEYLHKAKDKVEDLTEDIADKAENLWDQAIDNAEVIGGKVKSKAGDFFDDAKDFAEDVGEKVISKADDLFDDAKDIAEDVGEKVLKTADKAAHKAKDLGVSLSDRIKDYTSDKSSSHKVDVDSDEPESDSLTTDDIFDSIKEKSNDIGEDLKATASSLGHKAMEVKSDLVEKAKDLSDKLSAKLDDTIHKAEELARHETSEPEFRETNEHLKKSELSDKDDFFKKAEAFAAGRYNEVSDPFSNKPEVIGKKDPIKKTEEQSDPIPGFEDLDGDGNEIIDDALIESEEE